MGDPNFAMAARIGDSMPCETLYACNLCDKVKKEELRALLYTLFVQYGDVIYRPHAYSQDARPGVHSIRGDFLCDGRSSRAAGFQFPRPRSEIGVRTQQVIRDRET